MDDRVDVHRFAAVAQTVSNLAAWTVVAITLAALVGWLLGVDQLTSWLVTLTPMLPLTAIGGLLAAVSLVLLQQQTMPTLRRQTGRALAIAVALLATFVLARELFGFQWPAVIGALVSRPGVGLPVGHIPAITSLVGLAIASSILLIDAGALRIGTTLASVVVLCALTALLGYLYGDHTLYGGHTGTPISLPTITCFLLLGVSAFCLRASQGATAILLDEGIAGLVLRRLQLAAVTIPIATGWLMLAGEQAGLYSLQTSIAILVVSVMAMFSLLLWIVADTVHKLDQKRREAELAAASTRQRLEQILEQLPVGIALVEGSRHQVALINTAGKALLGYDPTGKDLDPDSVKRIDGKPYPRAELPLVVAMAEGKTVTKNDLVYKRSDGTEQALRTTAAPLRGGKSSTTGLLILEDYSKESGVERAKDEFLSLATHQLQTPLTGVGGFLGMLRDGLAGKLNKDQLDLVNEAHEGNERERHIVADLLNVGRADSGRMVLKKQNTDLSALVASIVREQVATVQSRHQTLVVKAPDQPIQATIDPDRLRMCLENLVSNASKYTKSGGHLEIRLEQTATATRIAVADSGVGVAKEDLAKLFKRFSRLDNELSQKVGGTGLGLYLVKQIVELHGGRVLVESELGKGTTFTIELPQP